MKLVSMASVACLFAVGGCALADDDGTPEVHPIDPGPIEEPIGPIDPGPVFGEFNEPVIIADSPPPPISGGTLLIAGTTAAISDPDHDQVLIVDLTKISLTATITLEKGEEPGRLVEDGAGRIHVALRSAGSVATLDPVTGTLLRRESVCQYPRGLAYDAKADAIHVACAGGELVTLPAAGGAPTRQLVLDSDLRDVVVDGDHLLVSRFRAAELLVVEADGRVSGKLKPLGIDTEQRNGSTPAVAWRTIAAPGGGALMSFQEEQNTEVQPEPGGYGMQGCGGIVRSSVSLLKVDGGGFTVTSLPGALPIDLAVSPRGGEITLASAGMVTFGGVALGNSFGMAPILSFSAPVIDPATPPVTMEPVGSCRGGPQISTDTTSMTQPIGQAVAVARDASSRLIVQTREPSTLMVGDRALVLPGDNRKDTGHELFHMATSAGLACASCHPEGREDGHTWQFTKIGARRTQSIGGGILGTEPFHWNGDMSDFPVLAHEVFNSRMAGPSLKEGHVQALAKWIDKIPAWKPIAPIDTAAVERGKALFIDKEVGCATCHSGARMTNNTTVDVGTGGRFQVPSLIGVARREPFLHQGCAPTLLDRFGGCGGGESHGHVASLTDAQRADLTSYLETL